MKIDYKGAWEEYKNKWGECLVTYKGVSKISNVMEDLEQKYTQRNKSQNKS